MNKAKKVFKVIVEHDGKYFSFALKTKTAKLAEQKANEAISRIYGSKDYVFFMEEL
jgi:hypothetical protein